MSESLANQSDESLARQASRGGLEAFDELVRRYQHRLYGFVLQLVPNSADARELTQDAFLRAFRALDQFRSGAAFSAWLFAIARNKAIDHLRCQKQVSDTPQPERPDLDDPSVVLARREDLSQIWLHARHLLPALHFQALWLRYAEDMDVARVAAILGKSRTHVKVLLFRARRTLAAGLGPVAESIAPVARSQAPASLIRAATNELCSGRPESAPTI
jgi:RNA polymerase sigma-70 factor (ECF subfamily)